MRFSLIPRAILLAIMLSSLDAVATMPLVNAGQNPEQYRVRLLGDGYAQLTNLAEKQATASVGLGIAYASHFGEGSLFLKKGTASTLRPEDDGFGQFLLTPAATAVGAIFDMTYYWWDWEGYKWRLGLAGSLEGGHAKWQKGQVPDIAEKTAFVAALNVGPSLRFEVPELTSLTGDTSAWFTASLLLSTRHLLGNVGSDDDFRLNAIGSKKTGFIGFTLALKFQINDIVAGASLVYFFAPTAISGFSGGQFVPSFNFQGGIDLPSKQQSAPKNRDAE